MLSSPGFFPLQPPSLPPDWGMEVGVFSVAPDQPKRKDLKDSGISFLTSTICQTALQQSSHLSVPFERITTSNHPFLASLLNKVWQSLIARYLRNAFALTEQKQKKTKTKKTQWLHRGRKLQKSKKLAGIFSKIRGHFATMREKQGQIKRNIRKTKRISWKLTI